MTTNEPSVLDKIRKLLRLAQSSNVHEAALAMERAFELASRHSINLDAVDLDEETRRVLHERFHVGARFSLIRRLTVGILENYFNVTLVKDAPHYVFIGTAAEVEIAMYVHGFLVAACSRCLRAYAAEQRRKLSENKRRQWIAGFMYGISAKLDEARKQMQIADTQTAVALRNKEKREAYLNSLFKVTTSKVNTAMMSGFVSGVNTEIAKGLAASQTKPLQLASGQ